GQRYTSAEKLPQDVHYLGFVALFRGPAAGRWRFLYDVPESGHTGISLGVHACALSSTAGKLVTQLDSPADSLASVHSPNPGSWTASLSPDIGQRPCLNDRTARERRSFCPPTAASATRTKRGLRESVSEVVMGRRPVPLPAALSTPGCVSRGAPARDQPGAASIRMGGALGAFRQEQPRHGRIAAAGSFGDFPRRRALQRARHGRRSEEHT